MATVTILQNSNRNIHKNYLVVGALLGRGSPELQLSGFSILLCLLFHHQQLYCLTLQAAQEISAAAKMQKIQVEQKGFLYSAPRMASS